MLLSGGERIFTINKIDLVKAVYPVVKMVDYGNGCYETIRQCKGKINGRRPERGKIKMQSKKSLLRLMFLMHATHLKFRSMLTLTYPKQFPNNGAVVKSDIGAMIQKARRANYNYLWFLEFQKRGAPHIHVLFDAGIITPKMRVDFGLYWTTRIALSDWFLELCPPGAYTQEVIKMAKFNTHHSTWETIRDPNGARNYVAKYASKERQKKVPKKYQDVGRFWGSTRALRPPGVEFDVTEDEIEQWLVDHGHPAADYYLVPRYLWGVPPSEPPVAEHVDKLNGRYILSIYDNNLSF